MSDGTTTSASSIGRGTLLKGAIGFAVGAVCLFLAFRGVLSTEADTGVSLAAVFQGIAAVPFAAHFGFGVLAVAQFVLRTERWRIQARGLTGHKPPWWTSSAINAVGVAAVFLLPFRLGEFVRPNLSAERGIMTRSAGIAATVLERAIDGIVTTGFFGVVLVLMRGISVPLYVRAAGASALVVFGGALLFLWLMFRFREPTLRSLDVVLRRIHAKLADVVLGMVRGFLAGLACFDSVSALLHYVALTAAYWVLNALSMWVLMLGMGIDAGYLAAAFCLCFLVIGVMIPAPPGNVGNFHAFARAALGIFGVGLVSSVGYAILLHASTVLWVVFGALIFLLRGDVSWSGLRAATSTTASRSSANSTSAN